MLICCKNCPFRGAHPRRTPYGPGDWCEHPDNDRGVPVAWLDPVTAALRCAVVEGEGPTTPARGRHQRYFLKDPTVMLRVRPKSAAHGRRKTLG